ncbi:hypothetical protein D3C87_325230 [compost metagenome]
MNEEILGVMEDDQAIDFVLASPLLVKEFKKEENKLLCFSDDLAYLLERHGCWIAGGAITSVFTGKEINDIDVYFPSKEAFSDVMAEIYEGDVSYGDARICHATDKSILISSDGQDVQFIVFKFFNSVEEIFKSFDFTAVMGAYSFADQKFILHPDFMRNNAQRFLSFNNGTDYPLISMLRVDKYRERGYTTSKQEMLKIGFAIANKNFDSWDRVIDEVGSMYGLNPEEIFDTTKSFSLDETIIQLENLFIPQKYKNIDPPIDMFSLAKRMPDKVSQKVLDYVEANKESEWPWMRTKYSKFVKQSVIETVVSSEDEMPPLMKFKTPVAVPVIRVEPNESEF